MPVAITMKLLARGQERYGIHCAVCHGATGIGNGITTQYGMVGVATFHDDRLRKMADGEIFNTISNGKGIMQPYGSQVPPLDRWAIIAYLRALQRSQQATVADVPPDRKPELQP
jgi:mono/diheme cytochrome c family protein